ncbi:MAG: DUF4230 domain-containing protein [Clostridiales bacterium]|nr:DUF4230 domain-containing protein [Clostridiales bacterium]
MKKRATGIIVIIIVICVVFVAALFLGVYAAGFFGQQPIRVEEKTEIKATTIEESIRAISELVTLSYNYTDVGSFSEQKVVTLFGSEFNAPFGKKSFVITYEGEMKIGVDMGQVSVSVSGAVIEVVMPPAKIMSHVVMEDSVELYDEKSGLFNKISVTDYTEFMTERKPVMEEKAASTGLMDQARDNAKAQIEALLLSLPGIQDEYEIRFAG